MGWVFAKLMKNVGLKKDGGGYRVITIFIMY